MVRPRSRIRQWGKAFLFTLATVETGRADGPRQAGIPQTSSPVEPACGSLSG